MATKQSGSGVYIHVDYPGAKVPDFDRKKVRRAFFVIGKAIQEEARSLISRQHGSQPGEDPGYYSGAMARSIGYFVPNASGRRPGFMVRIAPNQKRGRNATRMTIKDGPNSSGFYPAYLYYGVKRQAKIKTRRTKKGDLTRMRTRGGSGGDGWRIAPRKNYMTEALMNKKYWTERVLFTALRRAVKPRAL